MLVEFKDKLQEIQRWKWGGDSLPPDLAFPGVPAGVATARTSSSSQSHPAHACPCCLSVPPPGEQVLCPYIQTPACTTPLLLTPGC